MGLSTNILWHQTDFDGLKSIITSQRFNCSYSLEDIKWKSSHIERAFPMISFCNIPISDLSEYLKNNKDQKLTGKYGKYTIGLKHSWGVKCGLAPVWYLNQQSLCMHEIMLHHAKIQTKNWDSSAVFIWNILSHVKNYEGSLTKYGFKSYRFYDEREVRFVPKLSEIIDANISPLLSATEYYRYKNENKKSALINEIYLTFNIEEIAYILVSSYTQKKRVKELIGNDNNDIIILSYKHVIEDIIGLCHSR